MPVKTCAKCSTTKPLAEFYRDRAKKDGCRNECKDCTKAKLRRYYQANHEREIARGRYNYARLTGRPVDEAVRVEFDGTLRRRRTLWRFARKHALRIDLGKHCTKCGEWKPKTRFGKGVQTKDGRRSCCRSCASADAHSKYWANPTPSCARARHWAKTHPEKNRVRAARHRARKLAATGVATAEKLQQRCDLYASTCYLCGAPSTEMDHVKPLTKGGSNWPSNQRPICRSCNCSKNDVWPFPIPAFRQPLLGVR